MKEIELTSINFETLKKFEDIETQESVVYHDDKKVYKLYKNFNMHDLIIREMHVEETSKITNFKIAQPLEKIINNCFFCGCTMELKEGITLSKFEQNHSIGELKDKLIDISEGLEEIHLANKGLVLGDIIIIIFSLMKQTITFLLLILMGLELRKWNQWVFLFHYMNI